MSMSNDGLAKLMEECGEVVQIAAKMVAYPDTDEHPDGKGSMTGRLEEEIADVLAASRFAINKLRLDRNTIRTRANAKYALFCQWDKEP